MYLSQLGSKYREQKNTAPNGLSHDPRHSAQKLVGPCEGLAPNQVVQQLDTGT